MMAYLDGVHHPHQALAPRVAFVAEREGVVLGYIAGHLTRRYQCDGEVQYLHVALPHRRSGIASDLLRRLAGWFVQQGALTICVDVNDESPPARPFYSRHGARVINAHWLVWPDVRAVSGIAIVPYDAVWPAAFQAESQRLQDVLGALALRVEHHGSTAVPGLAAKPIIDIQVSVGSLQPLAAVARVSRRRDTCTFRAPTTPCVRSSIGPVTGHTLIMSTWSKPAAPKSGERWRFATTFVDIRRRLASTAQLKRTLADRHGGGDDKAREAYARAKSDFVAQILVLAEQQG